jgi:hypothetical protein
LIPVIGETDEVPAAAIKTADVLFADAEDLVHPEQLSVGFLHING